MIWVVASAELRARRDTCRYRSDAGMLVGAVVAPAGEGQEHNLHIEPDAPVFDVVNVVLGAVAEICVAPQAVDLGPAGHAGLHEMTGQIMRDVGGESVDVVGAFGAGADQAHFAAK